MQNIDQVFNFLGTILYLSSYSCSCSWSASFSGEVGLNCLFKFYVSYGNFKSAMKMP